MYDIKDLLILSFSMAFFGVLVGYQAKRQVMDEEKRERQELERLKNKYESNQ